MRLLQTILLIFLSAIPLAAIGQNYTKSLERIDWVRIKTKTKISVKIHDNNQLLIVIHDNYESPKRAKNLKLVTGVEDNTGIGCYVFLDGTDLVVQNLRNDEAKEIEIYLPASKNISVESDGLDGSVSILGFEKEIEVDSHIGDIRITDITGPATISSTTGNIEIVFSKVNQSSPITISTVAGELDVTLPKETPADVSLKSMMGEIYTNFKIRIPDKDGLKGISSQNVFGSINKGGVKIKLTSTMGNIYLRGQ